MTSAVLQWLAFSTMLVDHIGYTFFPSLPVLRAVGRLSFPIFAFLLTEGFAHTSDLKKYAGRLFFFGCIAELPYQMMLYHRWVGFRPSNILFALLLSLGALYCVREGGLWLLGAGAVAVLAQAGGFSYGAYGVLLAVLFYSTREKRWAIPLVLTGCTLLYCWHHHSLFQIWAVFAAIPLLLYNGEKGRRAPRCLLYILYPVHLAVLSGLYFLQKSI
ncbi:MAG: hypothetical protein HFE88_10295 [Acutalibacter sp.]|nr:hypothetical protein [Acutalibacter sp.]